MPKYHKSPKVGRWTLCKATGTCPYGDIPEAARKALPRKLVQRAEVPVAEQLRLSEVRIDYRTGGSELIDLRRDTRVAPAGCEAIACPACGTYMPAGYIDGFLGEVKRREIPCPNPACENEELLTEECTVDVLPSELKYWRADAVRTAHWFHITTSPNWLSDVSGELEDGEWVEYPQFVHVGSRESAMERLRDLRAQRRGQSPRRYYLYELALKPETPVNAHVLADITDGWPQDIYPEKPEDPTPQSAVEARLAAEGWPASPGVRRWREQQCYQPNGVTAYVNAYEAPGTVSLIANPTKLVQVAREEIPAG